jgi:hypothetical protein
MANDQVLIMECPRCEERTKATIAVKGKMVCLGGKCHLCEEPLDQEVPMEDFEPWKNVEGTFE